MESKYTKIRVVIEMGFRKNVRDKRRKIREIKEMSIRESKWNVSLREPSPVKDDEYEKILLMTKEAKQEMGYFVPFNQKIHQTNLRFSERDHCFTISSEELGLVGYLTFTHPDNLRSYFSINPEFPGSQKMISELIQAWVSHWEGAMGVARAETEGKPWCVLDQIYVKKEFRNKSFARQLYSAFNEFCIENGFLRLIHKPNHSFFKFSKKLGLMPKDWLYFHEKMIIPEKVLFKGSVPSEEEISAEKPLCQWSIDAGLVPTNNIWKKMKSQ